MFNLTDKVALVTGASGALGGAIARALHGCGATVVLSGTRPDRLEAVRQDLGARAHVVIGDLGDPAAPADMVRAAEAAAGRVDILVNNAGITRDMVALRLKDEDFETVLQVNLTAGFRLARGAMKGMMKRRWGRIIGITSVVGFTGNPGQANYAASKAGMVGLSKSLALELAARNVTVNCVAPGFMVSAMTDALTEQQRERVLSLVPAGRMGTAEDVAGAVVYLASEEASYMTGQTLHVNGGMAMY